MFLEIEKMKGFGENNYGILVTNFFSFFPVMENIVMWGKTMVAGWMFRQLGLMVIDRVEPVISV